MQYYRESIVIVIHIKFEIWVKIPVNILQNSCLLRVRRKVEKYSIDFNQISNKQTKLAYIYIDAT